MRSSPRPLVRRSRRIAALATAFVVLGSGTVAAATDSAQLRGQDLTGWKTVLGDGVWTGIDRAPVSVDDIDTVHHGDHSELIANVSGRGVMAHNITYASIPDLTQLELRHKASVEFRLPELPSIDGDHQAQTLEVGLFVWDGIDTRLDHGFAMQWVLNPWVPEYGHIRVWTDGPHGPHWSSAGYLEPDTEWHKVVFNYTPTTKRANLRIDGQKIKVAEVLTPKSDDWAHTTAGRFQVETISLWPGDNPNAPVQRAEFRRWRWTVKPVG